MVKVFADDYFHIGRMHLTGGLPCQDYSRAGVISGETGNSAFAVVSDGCSSGGHTDIGSRLITLSLVDSLKKHWELDASPLDRLAMRKIDEMHALSLGEVEKTLRVPHEDLLATCVYAFLSSDGGFVRMFGDGVIATKDRNGHVWMTRLSWEKNTPFYPIYARDNHESFINAHGGDLNFLALTEESIHMNSDGEIIDTPDTVQHSVGEGIDGIELLFFGDYIENGLEFLAVFSDGVEQIDGVHWSSAVYELMSFKNTAGFFAKRRMISYIKKTQRLGRGPIDDISYAVIGISPINDSEEDEDES